tara:strand:- start:1904 stop:2746 length:843 start_codon:yes stop_codon:yes gene_type:complete
MNIKSAIIDGASILKRKFIGSANLDSEILMAEAIKKKREFLILNSNFTIDKKDLKIFYKLIKKRSTREPIAYITNKKSFWSSEFFVTKDTLIPRPDTELIIENVLKFTKNKESLRILDIGIGSGCILLSILKEKKNFYGTGIDISKKCLKISKINAINLKVDHRLKLIKTDVDKFISSKYDLIVSNPPYIINKKLKYLDRDVVKYEPTQALNGGIDGLSEIRKVINKSSELIKKKGRLILEIGFDQKNKVINLLNKEGFYINNIYKDLADNDRCIVCTKL